MRLFSSNRHVAKVVTATLEVDGFDITIRRSARRTKSISLKIESDGTLAVLAPLRTTDAIIRELVQSRATWLNSKLAQRQSQQQPIRVYADGEEFCFLGQKIELQRVAADQAKISLDNGVLLVTSRLSQQQPQQILRQLTTWYRQQAEDLLPRRVEDNSANIEARPLGVQIKQYKSRWGSCTQKGMIQLNWRLIMAPLGVIDYVIIHELCHLKHFNHSQAFWQEVERFCHGFKAQKAWLNEHQHQLTLE